MSSSLFFEGNDKKIFDKEYVTKQVVYLKGVGRYCEVCGKHLFGYSNKKVCSDKCRWKKRERLRRRNEREVSGLHAFISLKKSNTKKPYRIIKVYLKKGVIEEVRITPDSKELWKLLDKITEFRKIPMEVMKCAT